MLCAASASAVAGVCRADLQQEIRPQPRFFKQRVLDELPRTFVGDDEE
jgi:hypothetical protein